MSRSSILLVLLGFSYSSYCQQKVKLQISPVDSAGNQILSSEILRFEVNDSARAIKRLKEFADEWINNGYLAFSYDSISYDSLNINAFLRLGLKYNWDSLLLYNLPFELSRRAKRSFSLREFLTLRKEIVAHYENRGYPFVQVEIDKILIEEQYIKGSLQVNKNDFVKFDSIVIKGKPRVSRKYLDHYIQIKPGDAFNQSKINEIDKFLDELIYLKQLKPAELEFRKGEADLYLYLKNKPANFFNGMIGFASGTEESPDFQLSGDLKLVLVNSFKIGERINLYWDKYNENSQNLKFGFQFPYLFILPLGIDFQFGLEKFNLDYLSTDLYGAVNYSFLGNNKIVAYFSQKNSYLIENDEETEQNINEFSNFIYGLSFYLNKTDYIFNPRKGFSIELKSGYGNRTNSVIESGSLIEFSFIGGLYIGIGSIGTIALLNKSAGLISDSGFYDNELYKIGGINSLRGFDEQSILSSTYTILSIEPRLLIGKNSSVYLFSDFAWYETKRVDNLLDDFPIGFGLGINIDTKAGIFKLNYALGKQFNNPVKISDSKVHFGFSARF